MISTSALAQKELLRAGPMLGYVEMQEANIWVQTTEETTVEIRYWIKGNEEGTDQLYTGRTDAANSFTKHIKLQNLEFGSAYIYELYLNGEKISLAYPTEFTTQNLWQWRTDPPAFTMAFGSCLYVNDKKYDRPGDPYGTSPEILDAINAKNPDLMIWMGDNVYYREPDFYSLSRMDYRYRDARDTPEMQPLLAGAINLATWDDHDYGPNNSNRSYRMREEAVDIFKRYWANPGSNGGGIYTKYKYNDVEFFLLDDRYFRAPNQVDNTDKAYFGEEQMQWLKDGLVSSNAAFKIVINGNQVTNVDNTHESFPMYKEEFGELMDFLAEEKVEGVLFLSGDVHYSQLLKTEREGLYPIYEFTSSPLTAGVYEIADSEENYNNPLHVNGTLVTEYNFGMIEVSGPRQKRVLTLKSFDREGNLLWEREVSREELSISE
ncbi:alkaline phosphatase family protein [Balneolaceae bacterium YR4-1]|uniref:Alkaline phosphatase family protein n=2 Tax=Halalkalibaculum roseum TaxID=2709311 RepID=A0A6M1SXV9_9BACT|nr:alkaline phosphatase family protein [Halalkalibaculum roseum]